MPPPVKSLGAEMLRGVDATQAEIATACGRARSLVGHWRNDHRQPNEADKATLERLYGIPATSWKVPAKRAATPPAPPVPAEMKSARERAQEAAARADALMAMAEASGVSTRERAALLQAQNNANAILLRCETEEEKIVRSPTWRSIENTLVDALRPFPEAAIAAAEALARIRTRTV